MMRWIVTGFEVLYAAGWSFAEELLKDICRCAWPVGFAQGGAEDGCLNRMNVRLDADEGFIDVSRSARILWIRAFSCGWLLLRRICTGATGFLADTAVSKMAVSHGQQVQCRERLRITSC